MATQSDFIASLVSQLQAGEISKHDLFNRLGAISGATDENSSDNGVVRAQQSPASKLGSARPLATRKSNRAVSRTPLSSRDQAAAAAAAALKAAAKPRQDEAKPASVEGGVVSGFPVQDRRMIIERIFTEKQSGLLHSPQVRGELDAGDSGRESPGKSPGSKTRSAVMNSSLSAARTGDGSKSMRFRSTTTPARGRVHDLPTPMPLLQSTGECTFTPKVRDFPEEIYGTNVVARFREATKRPVHERIQAWAQESSKEKKALHDNIRSVEKQTCTFAPNLSNQTKRIVNQHYGKGDRERDTSERLFRDSQLRIERRGELETKRLSEKEEAHARECTFQPRIPKKSTQLMPTEKSLRYAKSTKSFEHNMIEIEEHRLSTSPNRSRPGSPERILPVGARSDEKECTFNPKTNSIPKSMSAAAQWLKLDVVDRLSRRAGPRQARPSSAPGRATAAAAWSTPSTARFRRTQALASPARSTTSQQRDEDELSLAASTSVVLDSSWFTYIPMEERARRGLSKQQGSQDPLVVPSTPRQHDRETDLELSIGTIADPQNEESRQRAFEEMIHRQAQHVLKTQENRKRRQASLTPSFRPTLNEKSLSIMSSRGGSFDQRLELELRKSSISRSSAMDDSDLNLFSDSLNAFGELPLRFQPHITRKGSSYRARSPAEMSNGDLMRREDALKRVKERRDEMERSKLRDPKLTRRAQEASSKLKVVSDPVTYTDRIGQAQRSRQERLEQVKHALQEEEEASCTFKPKTRKCPSYVVRMAKASARLRESKELETMGTPSRPQWR